MDLTDTPELDSDTETADGAAAPVKQPEPAAGPPEAQSSQPEADRAHPEAGRAEPGAERPHPQGDASEPETEGSQPEADRAQPEASRSQPEAGRAEPEAERPHPQGDASEPETEGSQPEADRAQPKASRAQPEAGRAEPEAERPHPQGDASEPETEGSQLEADRSQPETGGTQLKAGGAQPETVGPQDQLLPGVTEPEPEAGDTLLRAMLEAIVYVTEEPLSVQQIAAALEKPAEKIRALLAGLQAEYEQAHHGLTIREVAGGYRMATKPEHHEAIRAFVKKLTPPLKLSLAALETLAVIAYKQPITAPEIMEIRGVQGAGVLKTLLDRKLITTAGRKQVIGKPILYKTTKDFLIQFGLKDLSELPSLKEFEDLKRLSLGDEPPVEQVVSSARAPGDSQAAAGEAAAPAPASEPPAETQPPETDDEPPDVPPSAD